MRLSRFAISKEKQPCRSHRINSRSGEGSSAVMSRPVLPAWLSEVAKCDVNPLVQRCQISKQMVTNKKREYGVGKKSSLLVVAFLSTRRYLYGHLIRGEMQVQCLCQEDLSDVFRLYFS